MNCKKKEVIPCGSCDNRTKFHISKHGNFRIVLKEIKWMKGCNFVRKYFFSKNLDLDGIFCVMFMLCLFSLGVIRFVKTYYVLHEMFREAPCGGRIPYELEGQGVEAEYITNERDRVRTQDILSPYGGRINYSQEGQGMKQNI